MSNLVTVVLPVYKPFDRLYEYELISWQQCLRMLGRYPLHLVCPEGFDTTEYERQAREQGVVCTVLRFDKGYFLSTDTYNKLLLSLDFFRHFKAYEYMLVTQLDVFVFEDKLEEWCRKGFSYVGAPWFKGFLPAPEQAELWAVGNGGFSLRNVAHTLRVLTSFSFIFSWPTVIREYFNDGFAAGLKSSPAMLRRLLLGNNTYYRLNDYHSQEDVFWSIICERNFSWYTLPTPQQALDFGFEVHPRVMYELNGRRLPMASHAWEKHDLAFWRPFIEQAGYHLSSWDNPKVLAVQPAH